MAQLSARFKVGKLGENALVDIHGKFSYRSGSGSSPREWSIAASSSGSGFGVVSSFSPMNRELAPATKHSATASRESAFRPALRRTIEAGIRIRAVAIVRTKTI